MHDRFTRRPSLNMLYFSFLAISGWCVTVTEHTKVRGDGKTAKFRTRCMINEGRLHARYRYQLYCHFLWRLPEWEQKSVRPISGMPGFLESRLGSLLGVGRMHATLANRGRLGVHLCRRGRIYFLGVRHVSSCWSMNSRWKTCDGWFHVPHGSPSPVGSRHVLGKSWLMGGKRHITKLGENVGGGDIGTFDEKLFFIKTPFSDASILPRTRHEALTVRLFRNNIQILINIFF